MKKFILLLCGLVLLEGGALMLNLRPKPKRTVPDPRYSPIAISSDVIRNAQDMTVLISDESMEGIGRGTGVLLDSTTVLTCAHLLTKGRSTQSLWIYPYPGAQVVHAKTRFVNRAKDLALLELTTPVLGHKQAVFASAVEIGEPIVVIGNIGGYMLWFVSYGIISGDHDRWVLTDAVIRGGNSGGPWVNAKGEIVALTDVGWQSSDGQPVGISGGVPVTDIQDFLVRSKQNKRNIIYTLTGN